MSVIQLVLGLRLAFVVEDSSPYLFDHGGAHMLEVFFVHEVEGRLESFDHVHEFKVGFGFVAEVRSHAFVFVVVLGFLPFVDVSGYLFVLIFVKLLIVLHNFFFAELLPLAKTLVFFVTEHSV